MHLAKVLKLFGPFFFLRLRGVQKKPLLATPGWAKFGLDKELFAYTKSLRCIRKIQENTEGVIIPSQFTSQGSVRFLQPFCYFTGHRIQRLQFTQSSKHVEKKHVRDPMPDGRERSGSVHELASPSINHPAKLLFMGVIFPTSQNLKDLWSNMIQWSWCCFNCFFPMYIEAF